MSDYDRTNTGIVSRNKDKQKDTHADIRGKANIEGVEYYIDGWQKQRNDGGGTFYSLKFKPVEPMARPAGDSARTMPRHGQQPMRPALDDEDSIPFAAEFR